MSNNYECKFLEWDSNYFGIKSARLNLNGIIAKSEQKNILKIFENYQFITISNTDCLSKYEILKIIKKVFNKDIKINSHISDTPKDNCLEPDFYTKKLENQLIDLKNFIK